MRSHEVSYRHAKHILKSRSFAIKRYRILLTSIIYFIEKINLQIQKPDINPEDLDSAISRLSRLLEVKKKLEKDIQDYEKSALKTEKTAGDLSRA